MFDYIRMWWLVNRVCKECLKGDIALRENNKARFVENNGEVYQQATMLSLDVFLNKRADVYGFGVLGLFPANSKLKAARAERDRRLLQKAMSLKYVHIMRSSTDVEFVIGSVSDGDYFAKFMNGFAGFLKEYREAFVVIILILSALNLYSQPAQSWMKEKAQAWIQKKTFVK